MNVALHTDGVKRDGHLRHHVTSTQHAGEIPTRNAGLPCWLSRQTSLLHTLARTACGTMCVFHCWDFACGDFHKVGDRMVFASCVVNHNHKRAWSVRMTGAGGEAWFKVCTRDPEKDVGLQTTGPPHREPRSMRDVATITRNDDRYLQQSVLQSARAPSSSNHDAG